VEQAGPLRGVPRINGGLGEQGGRHSPSPPSPRHLGEILGGGGGGGGEIKR